jgi:hypothetical protein
MNNTFLAFLLLAGGMYVAIKLLNLIFARFKILPQSDKIQPQSKREIVVESVIDSIPQGGELPSLDTHNFVNLGEVDPGTVGSEVVTSVEGLVEGVQALAESAVGNLSAVAEGLFH